MTEEEKHAHPDYEFNNGYLKKLDYKSAFKASYDKAKDEEKQQLLDLPNFDPEVFLEISGIDVRESSSNDELKKTVATLEKQILEIKSKLYN